MSANLELFEKDYIKEFDYRITAIADYKFKENDGQFKSLLIIGDTKGEINFFQKNESKLELDNNFKVGNTKIEKLIVNQEDNVLYVLTPGGLFIYSLPNLENKAKKDPDVSDIIENLCPKNKNELLVITRSKKIIFYKYDSEVGKLQKVDYRDKDKKPIEITLEEMPDKIKWYGENICLSIKKSSKIYFYSIEKKGPVSTLIKNEQDIEIEDLNYIQSSWAIVYIGGLLFFHGNDGQIKGKNMIQLNNEEQFHCLEIFNDLYIIALYSKSIIIYDYNDGKLAQELTTDTNEIPFLKCIFRGNKIMYILSIIDKNKPQEESKKDEKAKVKKEPENFSSLLWELKEFSFENQIAQSLQYDQIEKAFAIVNNKIEYNMDKFDYLESFYCQCGWNSFNKKTKEGYEDAEKYFSLCNFNPFELIYHFAKLLDIKPIHEGYEDIEKSPKVLENQIDADPNHDPKNGEKVSCGLQMLINILSAKKTYLYNKHKLNLLQNSKNMEKVKNIVLKFESASNCKISLKNVKPLEVKLFDTLKIINEALVKSMVLLDKRISFIEEIIDGDPFGSNYSLEFLKDKNTFTSDMVTVYVYRKNKKYKDLFKILEKYVKNLSNNEENVSSRNLLKKILVDFGKNAEYTEEFVEGLKILLYNDYNSAFEIVLNNNELLPIDNFIDLLNEGDGEKNQENQDEQEEQNIGVEEKITKKEIFLQKLCDDKKFSNYSNEKYQTLYLELLINKIFKEVDKNYIPPKKGQEDNLNQEDKFIKIQKKYNDVQALFKRYTKYNKSTLLNLVKDSWMYDINISLLTETFQYEGAIKKIIELVKTKHKDFKDAREYCKKNYKNCVGIFQNYFRILKENYDIGDDTTKNDFKKEMLKILELFIKGELLDEETQKSLNKLELLNILTPKEILNLIPKDWKLNEPLDPRDKDKTLFNLIRFYLKEYAIINNNYKRLENLAKIDLIYKKLKLYDLRDKHVVLDMNTSCYLCNKKIPSNTVFVVYPNGHIYHSRCSPDLHIEIKTGRNFENFDY